MGEFHFTTRRYLVSVAAIAFVLVFGWWGIIAFARLQRSGYHEARERELRDEANSLIGAADRVMNLPGQGSRWMIMAADQRRDASMLLRSAEEHARMKRKYLEAAMRPWIRLPPEPSED
jgi:hypothetical protein